MKIWNALFGGHSHTTDSIESIQENIAAGKAIMLDVRSQGERDAGYLDGSLFVPITEFPNLIVNESEVRSLIPDDKIIYCHCKAGVRAGTAAEALSPLGYDVRTLPQSFEKLVELGFKKA